MELPDGAGEKAWLGIERLKTKLQGQRCRLRLRDKVEEAAARILKDAGADRWVRAEITERKERVFRQEKRGHPGAKTRYLRRERLRFAVAARVKDDVIEADARTDGMFPLITNCKDLSLKRSSRRTSSSPSSRNGTSSSSRCRIWLRCGSRTWRGSRPCCSCTSSRSSFTPFWSAACARAWPGRRSRVSPCIPRSGNAGRRARSGSSTSSPRSSGTGYASQHGTLVQVFEPELSRLHKKVLTVMQIPRSAFRLDP